VKELRCSVCDQPVLDEAICMDCYDAGRKELPDPVTLRLSRNDCHTLLGYLLAEKKLAPLRVRFFDALEAAARTDSSAVSPAQEPDQ